MTSAGRRFEPWLIVLGSTGLAAWVALARDGTDLMPSVFCSAGPPWAVPFSVSFDLAFLSNSPAKLAFGWALMIAAMMSPLIIAPLRHVRDRSFARRRARSMLLFIAGYAAVWMAAGAGLQAVALAARSFLPIPLVWLGLAATLAVVWQVSPAKQRCLNRCHRQPHLAAFGVAADRDAFDFGLLNGTSCVGVCWALMLLLLFVEQSHLVPMIAVALFVVAERLERPAPLEWRWRGAGKGLRIVAAQARIRLVPLLGSRQAWR